ncbi:MAG TPA: polysaccharide deacetylase family protein [Bacillota bacterium]|nr:polysaccharide deacetylase family protein [Bacillota bacterium]
MERGALSLLLAVTLGLAACGTVAGPASVAVKPATAQLSPAPASASVQPAASVGTGQAATTVAAQDGPFVPNELGQVPILELHRVNTPEGRWQITPDHLRALLSNLYTSGFRPVDFRDVVNRHIDLPRGYAPVVLTFDDGDPSQFQWAPGEQGLTPSADSAVGILWNFHLAHPDWPAAATFFINHTPFGTDSAAKVSWLVAHGFEVGDHTWDHVDMTKLDSAQMLREVGGIAAWVQNAVPGYHVETLAYPYGFASRLPATAWDGTSGGQTYHIDAAVLVGANPAPSPYSKEWSPLAVPRIQVADPSTLESKGTLAWVWAGWEPRLLADNGAKLYVSDGNPAQVTIAAGEQSELAAEVPSTSVVVAAATGK